MQLTGQAVKHTAFGKGIVTGQEDNIIIVSFPQGEKRFLYPDAFQKFLTFHNEQAEEQVDHLLRRQEDQRKEELAGLLEEQERQQRIHNFKVSANSQGIFALEMEGQKNALRDWEVSTGTYLSGGAKGEPRIPDKMKPNTACLLTEKAAGKAEDERKIVGVFMVAEDFFGDECADGRIMAHPKYRLALKPAQQQLLRDVLPEMKGRGRWGSTFYKYCGNDAMQGVLFRLREAMKGTKEAELADDFYTYYCRQNRLQGMPSL